MTKQKTQNETKVTKVKCKKEKIMWKQLIIIFKTVTQKKISEQMTKKKKTFISKDEYASKSFGNIYLSSTIALDQLHVPLYVVEDHKL